ERAWGRPRELAGAVVISASLSSVTFPDTSPGRLVRAAAGAVSLGSHPGGWFRQPRDTKRVDAATRHEAGIAAGPPARRDGGYRGWGRPGRRGPPTPTP